MDVLGYLNLMDIKLIVRGIYKDSEKRVLI